MPRLDTRQSSVNSQESTENALGVLKSSEAEQSNEIPAEVLETVNHQAHDVVEVISHHPAALVEQERIDKNTGSASVTRAELPETGITIEELDAGNEGVAEVIKITDPESGRNSEIIVTDKPAVEKGETRAITVTVDGEEVDTDGVQAVGNILAHVREEVAALDHTETNGQDATELQAGTNEPEPQANQLEEVKPDSQSSTEQEELDKQNPGAYLMHHYAKNPAVRKAMSERGVNLAALANDVTTKGIRIDNNMLRAMQALANPGSDVWNTPPRINSLLGKTADENRDRLANVLRTFAHSLTAGARSSRSL
ncbi:MAG TPA: hypothetical protein PKD68_04170 [Candidatus Saccharibacteria bacterium]|nr:hypothetical protein [Candidatus Saccharibacteria bacterium]